MPEAESPRLRPDRVFYNSHRSLLPLFPNLASPAFVTA
jgi:hypothetical protein